jgi:hypothetical protein
MLIFTGRIVVKAPFNSEAPPWDEAGWASIKTRICLY